MKTKEPMTDHVLRCTLHLPGGQTPCTIAHSDDRANPQRPTRPLALARWLLVAALVGAFGCTLAPRKPTALDLAQRRECRRGNIASCLRQCHVGDGPSCYAVARAYYAGDNDAIVRNRSEYRRYLSRACDLRYGDACFEVGRRILWYQEGQCEAKTARCDKARIDEGRALITRACRLGSVRACRLLAAAFLAGELFFSRDQSRAGRYRQRACALGHQPSCLGP
ncbi:MAG: sel1 repeat family protein [Myxococcales bacterium]|nr:sel1 repeat family protein [Myxococcales bacterium]